ncbi:hypothetical protein CEQ90_14980 [Lewinellaceae bacterium SD302]|nr:hypothetical protein CEQ90_14980 [Lewinellaceae bacterium SD302]
MKSIFFTLLCFLVSSATLPSVIVANSSELSAFDDTAKSPSIFDHWAQSNKVTEVSIYLDLEELESKRLTPESLTGRLEDGEHSYDLKVEVRGRYRRRTCSMPPLKLHFGKQWLAQAGFNNHNDFKLVTHCTDDEAGQESLLREQLAYELYNIVSPEASYRTQLLRVNYVDTRDGSTTTSYAILIEDTDELKDRMKAESCKSCYNTPSSKIKNEGRVTLFNYMIGNTDYSFQSVRNLKYLKAEGKKQYTAVPYDFDFAALVDAPYANGPKIGGQRHLVWEFGGEARLSSARGQFLFQKDEILAQVDQFEELSPASRSEITDYLNEFFSGLENGVVAR